MKRFMYFLLVLSAFILMGCDNPIAEPIVVETKNNEEINVEELNIDEVKEELKEEIKQEVIEELTEEPELTLENYDYKTDPDTLAVHIGNNNIDQYFDLKIVLTGNGTYSVRSHSLMYDKGYVIVGTEHCDITIRNLGYEFEGEVHNLSDVPDNIIRYPAPIEMEVAHGFTTIENAQLFLKDIKDYHPDFERDDAIIYYQKIEDVKFGYEVKDGLRILNGEEIYVNADNLY